MPEFEQRRLAPVLDEAQLIVRGHPASPQRDATRPDAPPRYVQFEIAEVLKGTAPGRDIRIRQPEAAESSWAGRGADGESRENDVILLLGARDPDDGSYGAVAGFSQGGYVVESDQDGDWVLVNGPAIESGPVSPKDVHRNDVTEPIPLDVFRRIAASQMAPQP
ncbi:MAG: hypothetical protein JOZ34_02200, partial [Gammaproteobacteria bacterium]|nr:hypothetical protein [Gammaproteobacteria bacterium]